jgi:DNA-binding XRE family transcriptional regulator
MVWQRRYATFAMTLREEVAARRITSNPATARAIREAAGISLTRAAHEIPCSPSTLSRLERGLRRPRPDLAVAWARVLRELMGATD